MTKDQFYIKWKGYILIKDREEFLLDLIKTTSIEICDHIWSSTITADLNQQCMICGEHKYDLWWT